MSIDVWEPKDKFVIELDLLCQISDAFRAHRLDSDFFSEDFIKDNVDLMQQAQESFDMVNTCPDDVIIDLIQFFTLAEKAYQGWSAGNKSPVIYLVRILKSRGTFCVELRKWIKNNSDNRYLPHGSVFP
ncbi:MAG: hypothetical protein CBB61_007075 [Gammaproteobacteria bacterium TMED1]|nr:MAG: hypothetical protein CBB61_007075 [Gammaproteobacteria bacterium TMED1]|tara:strand:- start:201 stop:587 length:387 start_codon:yes stop_codon:yes gene_type:complete